MVEKGLYHPLGHGECLAKTNYLLAPLLGGSCTWCSATLRFVVADMAASLAFGLCFGLQLGIVLHFADRLSDRTLVWLADPGIRSSFIVTS
jgi:hypothetical protein